MKTDSQTNGEPRLPSAERGCAGKSNLGRADAQREILNHNLRDLTRWCHDRAASHHNAATTLTLLERKVAGLRNKLLKAGRDADGPLNFSPTIKDMTQMYRKGSKGEARWHYWSRGRWYPTPRDRFGFPPVRWLRKHGVPLLRSEIKTERHRSLCGKYVYEQGYRFDYYPRDMMYKLPYFAQSNETRGTTDHTIVCWPISEHIPKPQ